MVISLSNIDSLLGFWSKIEKRKNFQIWRATHSPQSPFVFCWRSCNSRWAHSWNMKFYTLGRIMLLLWNMKFHSDFIYRSGVIAYTLRSTLTTYIWDLDEMFLLSNLRMVNAMVTIIFQISDATPIIRLLIRMISDINSQL